MVEDRKAGSRETKGVEGVSEWIKPSEADKSKNFAAWTWSWWGEDHTMRGATLGLALWQADRQQWSDPNTEYVPREPDLIIVLPYPKEPQVDTIE